jgi:hypothetical protein
MNLPAPVTNEPFHLHGDDLLVFFFPDNRKPLFFDIIPGEFPAAPRAGRTRIEQDPVTGGQCGQDEIGKHRVNPAPFHAARPRSLPGTFRCRSMRSLPFLREFCTRCPVHDVTSTSVHQFLLQFQNG